MLYIGIGKTTTKKQTKMSKYQTISEDLALEWYDESYDVQGDIKIGNLRWKPSRIVKTLDPIAYNTAFSNFLDYLYQDGFLVEGFTDDYIQEEA